MSTPCKSLANVLLITLCIHVEDVNALDSNMSPDEPAIDAAEQDTRFAWSDSWHYKDGKGLVFDPRDSDTSLWFGLRFQTRYDTLPGSLSDPDDLDREVDREIDLKRGRIKGGGDLFAEWLQIYSEYDFTTSTLLDLRLTATWRNFLNFRIGQWKSEFNRPEAVWRVGSWRRPRVPSGSLLRSGNICPFL